MPIAPAAGIVARAVPCVVTAESQPVCAPSYIKCQLTW